MNAYRESQMSVGKAALLVLALAAGAGLFGAFGDGKTSHDVKGSAPLFEIEHARPAKVRLVGVVSGHTAGGLLIVPASDGPEVEVKAGVAKREKCPVDAPYPACLTRGGH